MVFGVAGKPCPCLFIVGQRTILVDEAVGLQQHVDGIGTSGQ